MDTHPPLHMQEGYYQLMSLDKLFNSKADVSLHLKV
jgi:hypothetical protein